MSWRSTHFLRILTFAGLAWTTACTNVPPLDDAILLEVSTATTLPDPEHIVGSDGWPLIRIAFSTERTLLNPDKWGPVRANLYICGADDPRTDWQGRSVVYWQSRAVTRRTGPEIEDARGDTRDAQTYEVFVPYTNWQVIDDEVIMLPPTDDLCLSIIEQPWWTAVGRPLRVDRTLALRALPPLPRKLE